MKNNRILILLVLVLTATISMTAQLRYGFRLGGTFAKATLTDVSGLNLKNGSGFSGGVMLEYQMEQCGFAPDLAVVYTCYNMRLRDVESNSVSTDRNFIEVPLHLKYKFYLSSTNNLVAPLIYVGPSLLFSVGHSDSARLSKSVLPGMDFGIGIDIVNFIQLTGGYRLGLGNAINEQIASGGTLRTNGWNVSGNIIFDF